MLFYPAKATALLSQALPQGRPLERTGSTAMPQYLTRILSSRRQARAICLRDFMKMNSACLWLFQFEEWPDWRGVICWFCRPGNPQRWNRITVGENPPRAEFVRPFSSSPRRYHKRRRRHQPGWNLRAWPANNSDKTSSFLCTLSDLYCSQFSTGGERATDGGGQNATSRTLPIPVKKSRKGVISVEKLASCNENSNLNSYPRQWPWYTNPRQSSG